MAFFFPRAGSPPADKSDTPLSRAPGGGSGRSEIQVKTPCDRSARNSENTENLKFFRANFSTHSQVSNSSSIEVTEGEEKEGSDISKKDRIKTKERDGESRGRSRVKVEVRVRPMNSREFESGSGRFVECDLPSRQILIQTKMKGISSFRSCFHIPDSQFAFDGVWGEKSEQEEIFEQSIAPLLEECLKGFNTTVFAYGQTGSGKTYTMGMGGEAGPRGEEWRKGVVPRLVERLFDLIETSETEDNIEENVNLKRSNVRTHLLSPDVDVSISCSFLEIYQEELRDLLRPSNPRDLQIREGLEGAISISGLHQEEVLHKEELLEVLERGAAARTTGETNMNSRSSRSHSILTISIAQIPKNHKNMKRNFLSSTESRPSSSGQEDVANLSNSGYKFSKFHLVDLAGSERNKRTLATGSRMKESININGGLLALGKVISALTDGKKGSVGQQGGSCLSHVPYRDSKLTRLLQDSLGGNSRTLMIACVSPCDADYDETLNTLKYAHRAKNIQNRPVMNKNPRLLSLAPQIAALQVDLEMARLENQKLKTEIFGLRNEGAEIDSLEGDEEARKREKEVFSHLKIYFSETLDNIVTACGLSRNTLPGSDVGHVSGESVEALRPSSLSSVEKTLKEIRTILVTRTEGEIPPVPPLLALLHTGGTSHTNFSEEAEANHREDGLQTDKTISFTLPAVNETKNQLREARKVYYLEKKIENLENENRLLKMRGFEEDNQHLQGSAEDLKILEEEEEANGAEKDWTHLDKVENLGEHISNLKQHIKWKEKLICEIAVEEQRWHDEKANYEIMLKDLWDKAELLSKEKNEFLEKMRSLAPELESARYDSLHYVQDGDNEEVRKLKETLRTMSSSERSGFSKFHFQEIEYDKFKMRYRDAIKKLKEYKQSRDYLEREKEEAERRLRSEKLLRSRNDTKNSKKISKLERSLGDKSEQIQKLQSDNHWQERELKGQALELQKLKVASRRRSSISSPLMDAEEKKPELELESGDKETIRSRRSSTASQYKRAKEMYRKVQTRKEELMNELNACQGRLRKAKAELNRAVANGEQTLELRECIIVYEEELKDLKTRLDDQEESQAIFRERLQTCQHEFREATKTFKETRTIRMGYEESEEFDGGSQNPKHSPTPHLPSLPMSPAVNSLSTWKKEDEISLLRSENERLREEVWQNKKNQINRRPYYQLRQFVENCLDPVRPCRTVVRELESSIEKIHIPSDQLPEIRGQGDTKELQITRE